MKQRKIDQIIPPPTFYLRKCKRQDPKKIQTMTSLKKDVRALLVYLYLLLLLVYGDNYIQNMT